MKDAHEEEGLWKAQVQEEERRTRGVCLRVGKKVERRKTRGRALHAHGKFTWWLGVSELGGGREEGLNN